MVMDVVMSRVGLNRFFSSLEELLKAPLFVAAASAPKLPKPLTRAAAAAATRGDQGISDYGAGGGGGRGASVYGVCVCGGGAQWASNHNEGHESARGSEAAVVSQAMRGTGLIE